MTDRATDLELHQGETTVSAPPLSTRVEGLQCPNCSGALEIDAGMRVVECPYCGTRLLALHEVGVQRYAIRPTIDATEARRIARRWLASGVRKHSALKKEAAPAETLLVFLPFFRVQADGIAAALGTEERRETERVGNKTRVRTYEVDVERTAERSFDQTFPAVNVAEWGIQKVDLRGDPLVPFDRDELERLGMVFAPTGSESEIFERAVASFRHSMDLSTGLKRTRFRFVETVRERLSVIYYPVWVVRYHFRDRSYQILVDAEDGTLSYGKAPGNDLYRALALVGTQAVTLYIATTALQFMGNAGVLWLLVGALTIAALTWSWRHFRYGGVVIEGSGTEPGIGLAQEMKTWTKELEGSTILGDVMAGTLAVGGSGIDLNFDLDF